MTEDRDFKRLVRARMAKTGEAYTTARAHLLAKSAGSEMPGQPETPADLGASGGVSRVANTDLPPPPVPTSGPATAASEARDGTPAPTTPLLPPGHETLAGMAEGTLLGATGHGWAHWVRLLDDRGARSLPHASIARLLQDGEGLAHWWAQTITVGYERMRGLRAPGQQRDGSWQVGKSRTFPVPVERLFQAFHDEGERREWLGVEDLHLRSARPGKVVRLVWPDGSVAEAGFTSRSASRSTVSVQHSKLPDGETADALKTAWGEALERLAGRLEPGPGEEGAGG